MDNSPNELNSNNFIYFQAAYLEESKNTIPKRMDEYLLFEAFERGEYINEKDLSKVTNYICGHLICWSPNRSYFDCQYNNVTKLMIVCKWRRKRGLSPCPKKEKQYAKNNLLTFLKKKNIKIVFARHFEKKSYWEILTRK